jgi:four helix bundle protein
VNVPKEKVNDKAQELRDRTKGFALRIIRMFRTLPRTVDAQVMGKQLLRSGTSVAANYRAACRSRSRPEFLSRLCVVLEEADECVLWMELLIDSGTVKKEKLDMLLTEARQLTAIFTASTATIRRETNLKF